LQQAGVRDVSAREFIVFSLALGVGATLIAQTFIGWGVISLLAAALGGIAPLVYYLQRQNRRRGAVQTAMADAIGQLRDSIRTGLSIQEALVGLARNGPEALRPEFRALVRDSRLVGFERALRGMRDRLADPIFDVVAATLVLNDQVGGRNVSQVLDRLAHATREQQRIHGELRAYHGRQVLSARIVAAVPVVVLLAIRAVSPEYLSIFDGLQGQLMLAGCLASIVVGYAGMRWLSRLPGEQRVLVE
jgi:tight adherence protein B